MKGLKEFLVCSGNLRGGKPSPWKSGWRCFQPSELALKGWHSGVPVSPCALTWGPPRAGGLAAGGGNPEPGLSLPHPLTALLEELGGARTSLWMWLRRAVWDFFFTAWGREWESTSVLLISQQPTVDGISLPRGSRLLWTFPFYVQRVSKQGLWCSGV